MLIAIRADELSEQVVGHLRAADERYSLVVHPRRVGLAAEVERQRPAVAIIDLDFRHADPRRGTLSSIREQFAGDVPGLLVIAHHMDAGFQVNALELGADACLLADHLTRESLQANVAWLVSRGAVAGHGRPGSGGILLSRRASQIHIRGETYALTATQLKILWVLASRAPAVVSPRELFCELDHLPDEEISLMVRRYVSRLRKKLGPHASLIRTVRGRGYQFTATAALVP